MTTTTSFLTQATFSVNAGGTIVIDFVSEDEPFVLDQTTRSSIEVFAYTFVPHELEAMFQSELRSLRSLILGARPYLASVMKNIIYVADSVTVTAPTELGALRLTVSPATPDRIADLPDLLVGLSVDLTKDSVPALQRTLRSQLGRFELLYLELIEDEANLAG